MPTSQGPAPFAVLAVLALAAQPSAQVSEYFLMAGDQSKFHVIQGGVLKRSWSPAAGTAQYQYPIAVTGVVQTMGANAAEVGALYDLNGTDLTLRYTHPTGPVRCWDGTTDGTYFYTIDNSGGIWQLDQTWSNPVRLFGVAGLGGLTYDPTNNSLWVSLFSGSMLITEYTLAGTVLRSFSTGHTQNMALALDHADGTLWIHDRTTQGTFEQWTKAGVRLSRIAVAGMVTQNSLGGEMPFAKIASCAFRNGTNLNPPDYLCVTRPALGSNWTTSYNVTPSTLATALAISLGGPATGPNLWTGELLIALAPAPLSIFGTGNIVLPIPNNAALGGVKISTQGLRLDTVGSAQQVFLLNAQDLVLGN